MKTQRKINVWLSTLTILVLILTSWEMTLAQSDLAQEAYLIFQQNCLNCHGEHGAFTEDLIIEHADLIDSGAVVPGSPVNSELYRRLIAQNTLTRMPLGQPPLSESAIATIHSWILAGAPNWDFKNEVAFISMNKMLVAMQEHLKTLDPFDRPFARYFTMTHLYNAGETLETRNAYKIALAKLVNSLSWGFEIHNPEPIDAAETIFYIDLRDYEWDIRDVWTRIETAYPYTMAFDENTKPWLRTKLANLRQTMDCEVPYVYVDWFLATAVLPPL